ncbi:PGAP1-like protein-domain-containing protein [Lipomyces arxii]|uniref:PGAP1-like protein-domain-containing protein n=1 Tax=Lipomyces arxii TaxID=56418 RepID=UPI0034CE5F10
MAGAVAATTAAAAAASAANKSPRLTVSRYLNKRWIHRGSYMTITVVLFSAVVIATIIYSAVTQQLESKGCKPIWSAPSYARIKSFDTSHTRFASKYSLYLQREQQLDNTLEPNGVPILFIPGNAGSYKQVRAIAAETAHQYYDAIAAKGFYGDDGSRNLDFFAADFNEDFTAFHGRTLLDQAEYLNDAVAFILSLYKTTSTSHRANSDAPLPRSVILLGHSMGGIVARTMLTLPNYRPDSVNTIITLSTPHVVPPATFDWDIVRIYEKINRYWSTSYSDKLIGRNPLSSVALISIAGGKLDVVVPSDYATTSSIVPSTNGFSVFTSGIPNVWTSVDHLAIVWCDQLRKSIAAALLDIVDVREPTQTKFLSTRLQIFRKRFLTGLESEAQRKVPSSLVHDTLLKVQDTPSVFVDEGRRVVLRGLGKSRQPRVYLVPIPKDGGREDLFSILTDQKLSIDGKDQRVDILLCEQTLDNIDVKPFSTIIDVSKPEGRSISFPCTNLAPDVILLPASTKNTKYAHDGDSFSYIRYKLGEISRYDYIAIVDSYTSPASGFVLAEVINNLSYKYEIEPSLFGLASGLSHLQLPPHRTGFVEISANSVTSSLLSYKLTVQTRTCAGRGELFAPLARQFLTDPNESKFYPNAHKVQLSLYGSAPYVPMTYLPGVNNNLKLQLWIDPTCEKPQDLYLSIDILGSMGNLVMRYRTAVAALPLAVVGMVLLIQFNIYDAEGVFINFGAALEIFLGRALPILLLVSATFIIIFTYLMPSHTLPFSDPQDQDAYGSETPVYRQMINNNMFLGLTDPSLSYLGPVFFILASGMCIAVYYILLAVLLCVAKVLDFAASSKIFRRHPRRTNSIFFSRMIQWMRNRRGVSAQWMQPVLAGMASVFVALFSVWSAFYHSVLSGSRRLLTTFVLLVSVLAYVPFQFAFVVVFIVHVNTCIRALRAPIVQSPGSNGMFSTNFVNFAFSILMLMVWVMPINIPVLIVWIHNLTVRWNTPFSSHHNLLSIMPIILLVERMITGKMVPRMSGRFQIVTKIAILYLIIYACLHGVMNSYWLHYIVNIFSFWLFFMYLDFTGERPNVGSDLKSYFDSKFDKRP